MKTIYRDVIEFLEMSDVLPDRLGLKTFSHDSTLKKFADRSSVLKIVDAMLHELEQMLVLDQEEAANDSTGLETSTASTHSQSRSSKNGRNM